MSLPLIIREAAEQDLFEIRDYYDLQREGLGAEFLLCAEQAFERIRQWPELYEKVYKQARRSQIHRFPYVVYYRLSKDRIEVVAVVHASRHPRVWRSRI